MRIEKKGLERTLLVKMIITIGVLVPLVLFYTNTAGIFYEKTPVEACRMSTLAHSYGHSMTIPQISLDCPRKYVHIDNEGYKVYYADELPIQEMDRWTYKEQFREEPSREDIYEIIAENLAECWYKMHEGNVDIFRGTKTTDKTWCLTCAKITFSKDLEVEGGLGKAGDFYAFTQNEETTKRGKNTKYAEYLSLGDKIPEKIRRFDVWSYIGKEDGWKEFYDFLDKEEFKSKTGMDKAITRNQEIEIYYMEISPSGLTRFWKFVFGIDDFVFERLPFVSIPYTYINMDGEISDSCDFLVN